MKNILLFLLTLSGLITQAQTLNLRYTNEIYFGASKGSIIDAVIKKTRDYYMSDVNGIIKKMRKKKGLKLGKAEKRIEFLAKMEADMRKKLMAADDWESVEINSFNQDYLISVSQLLAGDLFFIGVGKPNTGYNGDGFVTLMFDKKGLSGFRAYMATIKDYKYHLNNGHPYNDFTLGEISKLIRADLGGFTHERRMGSTNICSAEKGEPVYYEKFNLKEGNISGYIEAEFGAYVQQINSYTCRHLGNQLTSVSMYFKR